MKIPFVVAVFPPTKWKKTPGSSPKISMSHEISHKIHIMSKHIYIYATIFPLYVPIYIYHTYHNTYIYNIQLDFHQVPMVLLFIFQIYPYISVCWLIKPSIFYNSGDSCDRKSPKCPTSRAYPILAYSNSCLLQL